jgi:hypothetical protein
LCAEAARFARNFVSSPVVFNTRHHETLAAGRARWYPVPVHIENLDGLTRVLQASISPVALVSGVGLLILSQTNRFSRVADRLRELAHERGENPGQHADLSPQIDVLLKRARLLRVSIGAATLCVLVASIIVLLVLAIAVLDWPVHLLVLQLFAFSLLSLICSLIFFFCDMHLSLRAMAELLKHDAKGKQTAEAAPSKSLN